MDEPSCPGCRELLKIVAALETRIRDLEARLGLNSSNSSIPPSANPPSAPPPVVKKPTGRKPGGQSGHSAHLRQRLPADRITEPIIHYVPDTCERCRGGLPAEASAETPEPRWHQVVELPEIPVQVTEHQAHARICPCCSHTTWATIPEPIRRRVCGPRLTATMSLLTGSLHVSKRGVEEFVESVFGLPIALGTISNLEQEMSAALQPAHAEAQQAVQDADCKNVDETGWKKAGKRYWLWGAATALVACFLIAPRRNAESLAALLGKRIKGIICSDRFSVYQQLRLGLRQLCWAHLKRDFEKLIERGGESAEYGEKGRATVSILFHEWHLFRGGGSRKRLQHELKPIREAMKVWLDEGSRCAHKKTARFCQNLLDLEPSLWTFLKCDDVPPTNNHMERLLRSGVLWRKNSFGCHSDNGCRFVERILTVVQTLKLQKRPALDFLVQALSAHRNGQPSPKLLAAG